MPAFAPTFEADPRSQLIEFVDYFELVMDEISGYRDLGTALPAELPRPIFPPELAGLLIEAWSSSRSRISELRQATEAVAPQQLQAHGLAGPELHFKMGTVAHYSRRLFAQPAVRLVRKLLGVIDPALQSLLDTVGLGGALAEIKGTVEAGMDE